VIIADTRSSVAVADSAAAAGCAFDFDVDSGLTLAQRALSVGVAPTPLISARQRLENY
jgi:hypothetical protein